MKIAHTILSICLATGAMNANADCFDDAAAFHGVNPWILRGIASVESGFKPNATRLNSNGSLDVGFTQTNSVHFQELNKYGISKDDLYDPCKSIYVAGWLLRKKINKHGNTWNAVGAYHSETPKHRDAYAAKVSSVVAEWARSGKY